MKLKYFAMGTKFTFNCRGCGYKVIASGGEDYGMFSVTRTFTCRSCKNIVDVCVGELGIIYTREEILQKKKGADSWLTFYTCPECGSGDELEEWDSKRKPCPRCSSGHLNMLKLMVQPYNHLIIRLTLRTLLRHSFPIMFHKLW